MSQNVDLSSLSSPVMLSSNVLRLLPKLTKLVSICEMKPNLCVIALQETWLENSVPDGCIELPGFLHFRSDRKHSKRVTGGGVVLYIRKDWCSSPELILCHSNDDLDFVAVSCHQYVLASVYVNVIRNDLNTLNFLNEFVDKYCDHRILFLLGDFNRISFRKCFLNPLMRNVVQFPTREGVNLDQIWTNEKRIVVCTKQAKLSDHSAVLCEPAIPSKFNQPKTTKCHKIRKVDYEKLECDLENTDWDVILDSCESLDEVNDVTASYLKFCIDSATTFEKIECINDQILSNRTVKYARRKREQCWKRKDEAGFSYWHDCVEAETRRISTLYIKNLRTRHNSKAYWSEIKSLSKPSEQVNDADIDLDLLNKHFLRFERPSNLQDLQITDDGVSPPQLSDGEVIDLLKRNKNKTSSGMDGVPPWVLKKYSHALVLPMKRILNDCLAQSVVPSMWKKTVITPVPKPNSASKPMEKRYRPVGNGCSFSKTFEFFLLDQLARFTPDIDSTQFAYKKGVSTTHAVHKLLSRVTMELDSREQCVVRCLFLDFSSAFNTVSRGDILSHINMYSPSWLSQLIRDFFSNTTQTVRKGNKIGSELDCKTGVVQGGVISPFCFNIVTRELNFDDDQKLLIKFSDDQSLTFVLRSDEDWSHYQSFVDYLCDWFSRKNLCLNADKTQELVFHNKNLKNAVLLDLASRRICANSVRVDPAPSV